MDVPFEIDIESLDDHQLRVELKKFGVDLGPITDKTRDIYKRVLERKINPSKAPQQQASEGEEDEEEQQQQQPDKEEDDPEVYIRPTVDSLLAEPSKVHQLTDNELRLLLKPQDVGPIDSQTRPLYIKLLQKKLNLPCQPDSNEEEEEAEDAVEEEKTKQRVVDGNGRSVWRIFSFVVLLLVITSVLYYVQIAYKSELEDDDESEL